MGSLCKGAIRLRVVGRRGRCISRLICRLIWRWVRGINNSTNRSKQPSPKTAISSNKQKWANWTRKKYKTQKTCRFLLEWGLHSILKCKKRDCSWRGTGICLVRNAMPEVWNNRRYRAVSRFIPISERLLWTTLVHRIKLLTVRKMAVPFNSDVFSAKKPHKWKFSKLRASRWSNTF